MDPAPYYGESHHSFADTVKNSFIDLFQTIVVIGAIFALIYLFIAQFHKVSGNSMVPTLESGDYLITEKVSYRLNEPKRGDIIVLKNPRDESQDYIKRIIALPGDSIRIEDQSVYVNGELLEETYLREDLPTRAGTFLTEGDTIKAGPNQYFVIGDNRERSSDSRDWGAVTKEEIVGKAFYRYWPPQSIGPLYNK